MEGEWRQLYLNNNKNKVEKKKTMPGRHQKASLSYMTKGDGVSGGHLFGSGNDTHCLSYICHVVWEQEQTVFLMRPESYVEEHTTNTAPCGCD